MQHNAACSDEEFIELFNRLGAQGTANHLKINIRSVHLRRRTLERIYDTPIELPTRKEYPQRVAEDIREGIVLVGSDAHIWPGEKSLAMRAFIKFTRKLKPRMIVLNGDVMDFPNISRHPPIGWEKHPSVQEQIEAAQETLDTIERASFKAVKVWTLGNHDARFETRLASLAPEFAKIHGVHLRDHFPNWQPAWSVFINDNVVIKHRFKGGIHATHNNTLWAGRTTVTGHLHSQKVTPFTDYNGDRYGVDTGCLAAIDHRAFVDYTEDNPKNWRSGFVVLTFMGGKLLPPELVTVWDDNRVWFRGELIEV